MARPKAAVPKQSLLTDHSHMLPSLYIVSPSLQALGLTAGYVSPNSVSDQNLWRALPLLTTACVDVSVVEDFERFRRDIGGPQGALAVIDPTGFCVWNSTESFSASIETVNDVLSLENALIDVLSGSNAGDVSMREG